MRFGPFFVLALAGALATSVAIAQEPAGPSILVSRQLAEAEGLREGQEVQLATDETGAGARRFRIAGIYEPTPDPMRLGAVPREVRMHLPDLLTLLRDPATPAGAEHVDWINVGLVDPSTAAGFAREVGARLPGILVQRTGSGGRSASTFVVLERFHLAIAVVTIIAATVFLLALSIMLVDERRETVGVLRLIGLPARRILAQTLVEGLLIAGAGALFGLVLARLSEGLINRFFQWRYDTALIFVRITPDVAALCLAIAVPLGAAATVTASWALLRHHPTAHKPRGGGPGRGGLRLARR